MDLKAYCQIEDLEHLLKERNIVIPRLRGIDLCKDMKPFDKEELRTLYIYRTEDALEWLTSSCPRWKWDACCSEYSKATDRLRKKYSVRTFIGKNFKGDDCYVYLPNWDKIHGKHRKTLKYGIKYNIRQFETYRVVWDRYAGRDDVIRVHARIGGNNWVPYGGEELVKQPWFLEKVDDYYDSTYCDIYIKL